MTIKFSLPFICLFLLKSFLYGQQKNKAIDKIYYSAEDSLPVFKISEYESCLNVKYIFIKEEPVNLNIQFVGGYDALSTYCDSLYFNRDNYDHDELNAFALYSILFDKNLKIKDIQIVKRMGYNNLKNNYDNLIKDILKSSKGKWEKRKKEDKSKWYFYLGQFRLR